MKVRAIIRSILALLAVAAMSQSAAAQYPSHPIKVIVSALPGAATDILARVVAEELSPRLGQPIVVENRSGASSTIAAGQVAKSAPDGYTLMVSPNSLMIAPHMLPKGSSGAVDVVNDLVPVAEMAATPIVLLANPGLGVKTIQDFLALARRSPGMTYASGGTGSALHLAGELFQRAAGVKLTHIPYKGLAGATTDVVAGTVNLMFGTPGGVMGEMINQGKLVPLAVADVQRSSLLPNVPTYQEAGVKGAELDAWFMMFGPSGLPPDILTRLNREIVSVLNLPKVKTRLTAIGVTARAVSQERAAQIVRDDYKRYGEIVKQAGIGSNAK
jgi:tripartite-type tricarboxylate transporter receptor subunit TctC